MSASTKRDKFELPDGSCSISDIQDCFEFVMKKHQTFVDIPPMKM